MVSKYQTHWQLLKQRPGQVGIAVELSPPNLTDRQAEKAFNTLKKALQKQKLQDIAYNRTHVGAKLQSERRGLICRFFLIELTKVSVEDL